jgi:hypothetical protein
MDAASPKALDSLTKHYGLSRCRIIELGEHKLAERETLQSCRTRRQRTGGNRKSG